MQYNFLTVAQHFKNCFTIYSIVSTIVAAYCFFVKYSDNDRVFAEVLMVKNAELSLVKYCLNFAHVLKSTVSSHSNHDCST